LRIVILPANADYDHVDAIVALRKPLRLLYVGLVARLLSGA